MKSTLRIILFLTFALFNVAIVFGQEKEITAEEFWAVEEKGDAYLGKNAYRETSIWEKFDDRDLTELIKKSKSIYEFVPPFRTHSISEDENGRTERITIGTKAYIREGKEKWRLEKSSDKKTVVGLSNENQKKEIKYKFLEENLLNGKKVKVYQRTITYLGEIWEKRYVGTETYWIDVSGHYLKFVWERKDFISNSFTRQTSIYQYDPKIKITAPIK